MLYKCLLSAIGSILLLLKAVSGYAAFPPSNQSAIGIRYNNAVTPYQPPAAAPAPFRFNTNTNITPAPGRRSLYRRRNDQSNIVWGHILAAVGSILNIAGIIMVVRADDSPEGKRKQVLGWVSIIGGFTVGFIGLNMAGIPLPIMHKPMFY